MEMKKGPGLKHEASAWFGIGGFKHCSCWEKSSMEEQARASSLAGGWLMEMDGGPNWEFISLSSIGKGLLLRLTPKTLNPSRINWNARSIWNPSFGKNKPHPLRPLSLECTRIILVLLAPAHVRPKSCLWYVQQFCCLKSLTASLQGYLG